METVRVLFFGDVVGPRGLEALRRALPTLRTELNPDFVIANGENLDIIDPARGLSGMHPESLASLLELGVNAVTGGNHSFDPPWAWELLEHPRVLRPLNLKNGRPGRGFLPLRRGGKAILLANLAGKGLLPDAEDPVLALEHLLTEEPGLAVVVDLHSASVPEKLGLAFLFAGRVAAVIGTHTHVPTQDARLLPGGTAYVTDVGMVGAEGGIQGYAPERRMARLRGTPEEALPPLRCASGPLRVSFVWLELQGLRSQRMVHRSILWPE